jgi:hypothetical protein
VCDVFRMGELAEGDADWQRGDIGEFPDRLVPQPVCRILTEFLNFTISTAES